jgi:hypothetical protein
MTGPDEFAEDDRQSLDDVRSRDQDPLASLHDTEAEAGDEDEVNDDFDIDETEARELGVQLDRGDDQEPRLD